MTAKERMRRNLNPRPPAAFAMFHWPHDYAEQGGGTMDFFDSLHPADQQYCNDACHHIINAALNYGLLLKSGEERTTKPHARLKQRGKNR